MANLVVIFSFIAYLVTLIIVVMRSPKGSSPSHAVTIPQHKPVEHGQEPFELAPTSYVHTLQVTNFDSARKLMNRLNLMGLESTLTVKGEDLILQFTSPKQLRDVDKLKEAGLIKSAEIREASKL
jgi:hypothetical protein